MSAIPELQDHTRARLAMLALAVLLLAATLLLWRLTPLAALVGPERLAAWITALAESRWSPIAVVAIYVVGGLLVFPLTLLIAATAVVYEPLSAFALSLAGSLASAVVLYAIGARALRGTARRAFGPTLERVAAALEDRGVIAIAILRTVPIAPYTMANLAAGSLGVHFRDYVLGTALGLAPGIVVITAFGHQLDAIVRRPTPANIAALIAVVLAWLGLSWLLQRASSRWRAARARRRAQSMCGPVPRPASRGRH